MKSVVVALLAWTGCSKSEPSPPREIDKAPSNTDPWSSGKPAADAAVGPIPPQNFNSIDWTLEREVPADQQENYATAAMYVWNYCKTTSKIPNDTLHDTWNTVRTFKTGLVDVLEGKKDRLVWEVSVTFDDRRATVHKGETLWYRLDLGMKQIFPMKAISGEMCDLPAEKWTAFDWDGDKNSGLDERAQSKVKTQFAAQERDARNKASDRANTQAADEQTRAANLLRGRAHLKELSDEIARNGMNGRFDVGDSDDEVLYTGPCSQSLLDDLATRMKSSFSSFGFRRIRCETYTSSLE